MPQSSSLLDHHYYHPRTLPPRHPEDAKNGEAIRCDTDGITNVLFLISTQQYSLGCDVLLVIDMIHNLLNPHMRKSLWSYGTTYYIDTHVCSHSVIMYSYPMTRLIVPRHRFQLLVHASACCTNYY